MFFGGDPSPLQKGGHLSGGLIYRELNVGGFYTGALLSGGLCPRVFFRWGFDLEPSRCSSESAVHKMAARRLEFVTQKMSLFFLCGGKYAEKLHV